MVLRVGGEECEREIPCLCAIDTSRCDGPNQCGSAASSGREACTPGEYAEVGDVAPELKLQYFDGKDLKDVTLSQYRGKKNVVLAFYVFAFTGG